MSSVLCHLFYVYYWLKPFNFSINTGTLSIFKFNFSGEKFEWPDLKIKSQLDELEDKTKEDVDDAKEMFRKEIKSDSIKYRPGVPTFFGL